MAAEQMERVAAPPPQSVEALKKNRIQVSNTKKPLFFYVNLAKRYIKQYKETQYFGSDCGGFFDILIMAVGQLLVFALLAWNGLVNSLISTLFFGMEERSDMGAVQVFVKMPNSKVSCEVFVVALAELLRYDIHNIDGPELRESETQQCLARIVSCSHICIVASIDHVNAPLLNDNGLTPDAYSYDPLVSTFCKEGRLDLAIEFLDYMISDGCLPDIVNYNTILAALCKNGKANQALQHFENLGEVRCPPNVSSYNTMFNALSNYGESLSFTNGIRNVKQRNRSQWDYLQVVYIVFVHYIFLSQPIILESNQLSC
ncbi:hypothetical protein ACFX19_028312 [Malus domestica]